MNDKYTYVINNALLLMAREAIVIYKYSNYYSYYSYSYQTEPSSTVKHRGVVAMLCKHTRFTRFGAVGGQRVIFAS